ncbi:FAD-dependent oxidoreductase, partial [Acidithiobacillus thiooxidans]
MRVAIIGAGISGLGAAWILRKTHSVSVFEAADYPGGHTHTVDVSLQGVSA